MTNDSEETTTPPLAWVSVLKITSTADVRVPERLIDQVIGQEAAVEIVRKAAEQKRHLLLIGDPGTGKSMLAQAMAEVLPAEKQSDVLAHHNAKNPNTPKITRVEGGMGRRIVAKYERKANQRTLLFRLLESVVALGTVAFGLTMWLAFNDGVLSFLFSVMIALLFVYFAGQNRPKRAFLVPKLLVEHGDVAERAPFVDSTGAHAGALLGDVRHDPFQSGGLETPPHARVEAGAIHRADKGVLFIDEINVLRLPSQQALLTAMQNREYSIVGQSQTSSGAMIRTAPVPCDFVLVAAGNLDAIIEAKSEVTGGMHPALRSRIRGYGYEVYVASLMDDTHSNREKLVQFIAQEVARDGKIPHFDAGAIAEIIGEAQRRSGRSGKLTLRLRELGGLVRAAGDFAHAERASRVTAEHVHRARRAALSLEQQIVERRIHDQRSLEGEFGHKGTMIGVAVGVSVVGTGEVGEPAGLVVPVEAAVVPALSRHGGAIVFGPGLSEKRGSSIANVGALVKVLKGDTIADFDLHLDAAFGHIEASGEGLGIAAAVAMMSALENLAVRQDTVLIGDVTVGGRLRPVRATLQRVESAALEGYRRAIVPASLHESLPVQRDARGTIEVLRCDSLAEAVAEVIDASAELRETLVERLRDRATEGRGAGSEVTP